MSLGSVTWTKPILILDSEILSLLSEGAVDSIGPEGSEEPEDSTGSVFRVLVVIIVFGAELIVNGRVVQLIRIILITITGRAKILSIKPGRSTKSKVAATTTIKMDVVTAMTATFCASFAQHPERAKASPLRCDRRYDFGRHHSICRSLHDQVSLSCNSNTA